MTENCGQVKMRDRSIDMVKGLGIWCIVFLHYESGLLPWQANIFIGNFMITVFYITAGWLMGAGVPIPTKVLLRKRLRSLGLPYLYWSLIILGFDTLLWAVGYYEPFIIGRDLYKTVVLRGIGTLWFLPALFFGEVIWNWMRTRSALVVMMLMTLLILIYWKGLSLFDTPDNNQGKLLAAPLKVVGSAISATVGVSAGYYFRRYFDRYLASISRVWLFVGGLIVCVVSYFFNINMSWFGAMQGVAQILLGMTLPPIGFLLVFKALGDNRLLGFLDYWGRNSLSLMVTHFSIVMVLALIFVEYMLHSRMIGWISVGAFLASIPIQYLLAFAINRYCPKLVSKK